MKKFYVAAAAVLVLALTFPMASFAAFPGSPTVANQAKVEILSGKVRIGDTFKIVLKTQAAASSDTASIGSYSTTGELATAGSYTQGGATLSGCAVTLNSTTAQFTCTAQAWNTTSAIVFDAVEIYDSSCGANSCTNANQVIGLFPVTSMTCPSSGTCTVTLPAATFSIQ
jgi:hypothetical protein